MVLPWSKTTAFSFASEYVLLTLMEDKIPEGGAMFHFFFFFKLVTAHHCVWHKVEDQYHYFAHYLTGIEGFLS